MGQRVNFCGKLNFFKVGEGKPSLNRATQSQVLDAKPDDLSMARVKVR